MKKYFISALACAVALVSCVKENNAPEQIPGKGQKITISATIPADGLTKVAFAEDGVDYAAGLKLTWEEGDAIVVIDAANSGNFSVFELTGGKGTATGVFSGDALTGATSYIIQYSNEPKGFNCSEQTQATDGSTSHLKYSACLNGVSEYESFTFSEAWATSKGGTFQSSSVLRVRADIPMDIDKVQAVYIKVDEPVFDGKKEIKVNITNPADAGEPDVLTVYASLPMGMLNNIPNTGLVVQFQVSDKAYDKFTAYRPFSKIDFKAGQVNSIAIDCNTDQDITKYANKSAENIGTAANPYLIGDQHQMAAMASEMISKQTVYFVLVDDVDMTGIDWIPLNWESPYKNRINFNGGKHTISNLTVDTKHMEGDAEVTHGYPSFFGVAYGVIKDVTFDLADITAGSNNAGVVAGYVGTTVDEVDLDAELSGITVSNSKVVAEAAKNTRNAGVFAGVLATAGSSVTDCHVEGKNYIEQKTTSYTGCSIGGLFGNIIAAATIDKCTAKADLNNIGSYYTGGLIGQIGSAVKATIKNSAFLGGEISAGRSNTNSPVGGFIGRIAGGAGVDITDCYVDGAIITCTNSGRIGGFVGDAGSNATVNKFTSCYVKNSTISGGINTGGFAGTYGSASKCYVESTTVTANSDNAGGFIAYFENSIISDCYSSATVVGGSHKNIGGFIGNCRLGTAIEIGASASSCFASGAVSGTAEDGSVGAFIGGLVVAGGTVTKCIGWNSTLPFYGANTSGSEEAAAKFTNNYAGTEGSISSQATTLGWDTNVWDLNGPVPTFKVANLFGL